MKIIKIYSIVNLVNGATHDESRRYSLSGSLKCFYTIFNLTVNRMNIIRRNIILIFNKLNTYSYLYLYCTNISTNSTLSDVINL